MRRRRSTTTARVFALALAAIVCQPGVAQVQFDELVRRTGSLGEEAFDGSEAVLLCDLDGDGDSDLFLGGHQGDRLYLNDGAASFVDVTVTHLPTVPTQTYGIACADVDGDGDPDLVLAKDGANLVYLNDGASVFTLMPSHVQFGTDTSRAVVLVDVDADGDQDLIVGNAGPDVFQTQLCLNDGAGVYTDVTAAQMPVDCDDTRSIVAGDVDGDGDPDLVLGSEFEGPFPGKIRLYLNDGAGTFASTHPRTFTGPLSDTQALALGDVDGDGDLDVVAGNATPENFSNAVTGQDRLYLNDGTGSFVDVTTTHMPVGENHTRAIALGDVDADGDPDLLVGRGVPPGLLGAAPYATSEDELYLNDGSGRFERASPRRIPDSAGNAAGAALEDLDGDGDLDIFLAETDGFNSPGDRLFFNAGNGTFFDFEERAVSRLPTDAAAVVLGDVDADGDLDMVVGNGGVGLLQGSRQNLVYVNAGHGRFTVDSARLPVDSDITTSVALGDIDADGDLDLVTGNWRGGFCCPGTLPSAQNRVYVNDGSGYFSDETMLRLPSVEDDTWAVSLVDVDADGDLDLLVGNYRLQAVFQGGPNQQTALYENDGSGVFTDVTALSLPSDGDATQDMAVIDVDADGDPDLVLANESIQNRLYVNDGLGSFSDVTGSQLPAGSAESVAGGDVDGDGDVDLVFADAEIVLLLNDGSGAYVDVTGTHMPGGTGVGSLALGDVDDDGDLDLFFERGLYVNDGFGFFSDASATRVPSLEGFAGASAIVAGLALGDVDGDGDLDLAAGAAFKGVRLLVNLHRHLSPANFPARGDDYALQIHAKPSYGASSHTALPVLGIALAQIPLPVGAMGHLYLDPTVLAFLPPVAIPQATGIGTYELPIPLNNWLVGKPVLAQAWIVNDANLADAHFTSYLADPIQQ